MLCLPTPLLVADHDGLVEQPGAADAERGEGEYLEEQGCLGGHDESIQPQVEFRCQL